ncbi:MAG: efflux RND transporter permease subunit, partial [Thermodesulfobacteriota bacterium]|nr:efflux RND transporter permease subunit [Thermodesulfobacteriota bacterium]
SIVLKREKQEGNSRFFDFLENGFTRMENVYSKLLTGSVKKTLLVIVLAAVVSVAGVGLFRILPSEFLPVEDRAVILTIILAPEGSTLDYTLSYVKQVEQVMLSQPEVERAISVVGLGIGAPGRVSQGLLFATLKPLEERERKQQEIVQDIFPRILGVPGVLAFPVNPPSLGRTSLDQPISFIIKGNDYDSLFAVTEEIVTQAQKIRGVINLNSDLKLNKPELLVEIDRNKANDLGISVRNIATTLQVQLGGKDFATFEEAGEQYKVIVQLEKDHRTLPDQLEALYLRGDQQQLVQLSNLVTVSERTAPRELNHYDRRRAVTITASLLPGVTLGQVLKRIETIAGNTLP